MPAALLINTVDAATLGFTLSDAPGWLDAPPRQTPSAGVIGREGETALAAAVEATRRVTLRGTIMAATAALARGKVDSFKLALLANPLKLTFSDNATRYVSGALETFAASADVGPFVQEGLKVEAAIRLLNPLSYDIAQTNIAFGARLPLGTGPVRPVITINGAATNPTFSLFNSAGTIVASITITIATIVGDTLIVDMDAKTVKKNGVNQIAAVTAGDFFTVDPADQANFGGVGPLIATSSGNGNITYFRSWR
jgi:phage-related protein